MVKTSNRKVKSHENIIRRSRQIERLPLPVLQTYWKVSFRNAR